MNEQTDDAICPMCGGSGRVKCGDDLPHICPVKDDEGRRCAYSKGHQGPHLFLGRMGPSDPKN